MSSARPIDGSATLVIEASRTTTNWLAASRASSAPLRTSAVLVLIVGAPVIGRCRVRGGLG